MSYYSLYKNLYGHDHTNEKYVNYITKRYKYCIANDLPKEKKCSILELGCANGMLLYSIKDLGYTNLTGVELDNDLAKVASSFELNIKNENLIDYLKKTEEKFDVILMFDVLEHIKKSEIKNVLKLIYNALNYDGKLILAVPNASSSIGAYYRYIDWTHNVSFTAGSAVYLLQQSNFKNITVMEDGPNVLYDEKEYENKNHYNFYKEQFENYEFSKKLIRWNNKSMLDKGKLNMFTSPNLKIIAIKNDIENVNLDVDDSVIDVKKYIKQIKENEKIILNQQKQIENLTVKFENLYEIVNKGK